MTDFEKLVEFLDNDPTLIFKLPENLLVRVLNEVNVDKYVQCMLDNPLKHTNETVKNIFLKYGYDNSVTSDLKKEPQQTPPQPDTVEIVSTFDEAIVEKFYNSFLSVVQMLHITSFMNTLMKYWILPIGMTWS